jgi:hypothetical protein
MMDHRQKGIVDEGPQSVLTENSTCCDMMKSSDAVESAVSSTNVFQDANSSQPSSTPPSSLGRSLLNNFRAFKESLQKSPLLKESDGVSDEAQAPEVVSLDNGDHDRPVYIPSELHEEQIISSQGQVLPTKTEIGLSDSQKVCDPMNANSSGGRKPVLIRRNPVIQVQILQSKLS